MNLEKIALTRRKRHAPIDRDTLEAFVQAKRERETERSTHWADPVGGWITGTFNLKRSWAVTRFVAYPSIIDP